MCGVSLIVLYKVDSALTNLKNKMIKKLKISLLLFAVLALALSTGFVANAADLTFSADAVVTVNSNNYTITSGSAATSIVVGATTLTVTVPDGSQLGLVSLDRYQLNNDSSITQTCSGSSNSMTITGPKTVIVTPAATACTLTASGGLVSSGGGGGGGGVGGSPVVTVTSPTTTTTTTSIPGCTSNIGYSVTTGQSCAGNTTVTTTTTPTVIAGCGSRTTGFSTTTGQSCANNAATTTTVTTSKVYNFGSVTLKNGSKGEGVKELQRFLNAKLNLGLVIDGKLGPKTIAVIKKWQKDHGLKADGLVGAKTKAKMNAEALK